MDTINGFLTSSSIMEVVFFSASYSRIKPCFIAGKRIGVWNFHAIQHGHRKTAIFTSIAFNFKSRSRWLHHGTWKWRTNTMYTNSSLVHNKKKKKNVWINVFILKKMLELVSIYVQKRLQEGLLYVAESRWRPCNGTVSRSRAAENSN